MTDPIKQAPLIVLVENMTIGAITMILISGAIWGAGLTVAFLSRAACVPGGGHG